MKKITTVVLLLLINMVYANTTVYHLNIEKHITKKDIFYYAKIGNPVAQYDLATRYRDGIQVPVNLKRAFYYYHKSAIRNYPPAQYQLGMAFRNGFGIRKNQELARYWIRKSAKNRYRDAQTIFNLYYAKKQPIQQHRFQTIARY